jgi:hypothetical protein
LCFESFISKDNINIKRKRGKLGKYCVVLSGGPYFPAPKNEPNIKIKKERPKKYSSKPSLILFLII